MIKKPDPNSFPGLFDSRAKWLKTKEGTLEKKSEEKRGEVRDFCHFLPSKEREKEKGNYFCGPQEEKRTRFWYISLVMANFQVNPIQIGLDDGPFL